MKRYLVSVLGSILFLAGFALVKADISSNTNDNINASGGTCQINPAAALEGKIEKKVDAAQIDYSLNPARFREKLIKDLAGAFGQENLDKIGYFVYTMLPDGIEKVTDQVEVITVADNKEQITLNGSYIMTDKALFKKYGSYFFEAKARNPQLVGLIRQVKSNFKPEDLGTAFPNKFIQLNDGRMIILFSGCTAHLCGGTENMVAYDFANGKAYLLEENSDSTRAYVYGNPDREIRNSLLYEYLYH